MLCLGGNYINIKYNNDGVNTFISVESSQMHSSGINLFPYYLESNKILSSTITPTTPLFIGIQQENGVFYITFSITT